MSFGTKATHDPAVIGKTLGARWKSLDETNNRDKLKSMSIWGTVNRLSNWMSKIPGKQKRIILAGLSLLVFGIAGVVANIVLERPIGVFLFACMAFIGVIVLVYYR